MEYWQEEIALSSDKTSIFLSKGKCTAHQFTLQRATAGARLVKGEAVWVAKTLPRMLQSVGV